MFKRLLFFSLFSIFCSGFLFKFVFAEEHITEREVMNFTYHLAFSNSSYTLKDGKFKSGSSPEDFVEVYVIDYRIADLNGDGVRDTVVILGGSYGGSGFFVELTALLNYPNKIIQTNSVLLGDRVKIKSFTVKEMSFSSGIPLVRIPPEINLEILTQVPNAPMAIPTRLEERCFKLYNNTLIECEEVKPHLIVKKPAIYLYPLKRQRVNVKVKPNGIFTKTIPQYKDGWNVIIDPKGKIDNKYDYLFYEVKLNTEPKLKEEGWMVSRSELSEWFDKSLPKLGLKGKEVRDFKKYWLKELPKCNYYEIKLVDEKFLTENLSLEINPNPDTIIRVILYFKCSGEKKELRNPLLSERTREGFTVVEWGGMVGSQKIQRQK